MKFVFTGPESTGKTHLARQMARIFDLPTVEEYAREFLTTTNGKYTIADLPTIARRQHEMELALGNATATVDTDVLTVKIWSAFKYREIDPYYDDTISAYDKEDRFYFLCKDDIPWEYDAFREGQFDRDRLFDWYMRELRAYHLPFMIVSGDYGLRSSMVRNKMEAMLY